MISYGLGEKYRAAQWYAGLQSGLPLSPGYGAKKPWEGGRGPNSTGFENIYEPPAQGGS